ncbi:hypothetical protein RRG08_055551 [Elysia crispata]|uniref:Uncharacterized protein n=1 Tax=Elysia crispata TaxID=231223 RepID=A0AAE1AD40_9GAST|nr:hypothetical protein RRG08_055551 [Elysia crispata]
MCVEAFAHAPRTMGCGKSRLRSPENSDVDLKKNSSSSSGGNAGSSAGKNSKKNSRNGGGKCNSGTNKVGGGVIQQQAAGGDATSGSAKSSPTAQPQSAKKKKFFGGGSGASSGGNERKSSDKEKDALLEAKAPTSRKSQSNGKSVRPRERNDEIGVSPSRQPRVPASSSSGAGPGDGADRLNGGNKAQSKPYLLEVPNEIPSTNNYQTKTGMKDFKSLTASKIVHVTKSQIEFFKMLDEKIERGEDYVTSGNTSEVSSLCDFERH